MDKHEEKIQRIELAAFELLEEKGYHSTSMLQIAKRAGTSNQTLYAWYGNKQKLFQKIIEKNGQKILSILEDTINSQTASFVTLETLGPVLLEFITSEQAVVINRAAIIDSTKSGLLAEAIDSGIRLRLIEQLQCLFRELVVSRQLVESACPNEVTEVYLALLFGELQMRQVMAKLTPISEDERKLRANRAVRLLKQIYSS